MIAHFVLYLHIAQVNEPLWVGSSQFFLTLANSGTLHERPILALSSLPPRPNGHSSQNPLGFSVSPCYLSCPGLPWKPLASSCLILTPFSQSLSEAAVDVEQCPEKDAFDRHGDAGTGDDGSFKGVRTPVAPFPYDLGRSHTPHRHYTGDGVGNEQQHE